MPRLSIAILSNHGPSALETTLVSVLENRPADCEVVVALGHAYDDPYQLEGEVRFVRVEPQSVGLSPRNAALAACRGDVIHLLTAGALVDVGWADAAVAHFERDSHIGSVAPLVLDNHGGREVVSAGIEFTLGGRRRERRSTMARSRICESNPRAEVILGPSSAAGFYRREALTASCACLGHVAGDVTADADVALSLAALGYLSVLEPRSVVYAQGVGAKPAASVAGGRAAETVFWRHAAGGGWCVSLAAHAALVFGEVCTAVVRPALVKRLLGRLWGVCGMPRHVGHAERLAQQHRPADGTPSPGLDVIAIDSSAARGESDRPAAARRAA